MQTFHGFFLVYDTPQKVVRLYLLFIAFVNVSAKQWPEKRWLNQRKFRWIEQKFPILFLRRSLRNTILLLIL